MPTTASTPRASSSSISCWVVMPPAAVTRRVGGVAHGDDRLDVRAAHQPLGVDVGVEELVAERLERADRLDGGQRQRGLPAVNHDVAAAAVDGRDDALAPTASRQRFGEHEIGLAVLEERRAGDDLLRAGREDVARAFDGADAAADAARAARRRSAATIARLSPVPIAASRSMTCTFGKRSNRRTQRKTSSSRIASRSPCTSCTTAPPLKIDRGDQHQRLRRTAVNADLAARSLGARRADGVIAVRVRRTGCLSSERVHAGFRVVKDRRGERGVGAAGGEDVDEVVEPAGAARRDHRESTPRSRRPRSARSRSRSWCRRGRSRSAGSRRRRAPRPRAPTRRRRGRPPSGRCARRRRSRSPSCLASIATTTAWLP